MKIKRFSIVVAALAACACVAGCSDAKGGSVDQGGKDVFPVSSKEDTFGILLGDVMPFYDDGVMNIYHLQNSTGTNSMYYHPISRLTTTDYVEYTDCGIAINFDDNDTSSPDAALGTGSFIKDKNGNYHCFYTGHNADGKSGLPRTEVVRHAVSYDGQETWQKIDDFNLYGYSNDFRDPYVYWDSADKLYYMLVTTEQNGSGVILRYSSDSLDADDDGWKNEGVFFANDSGKYIMECPSYIEYNDYCYLMYSEQGANRVTHYRYKKANDEEWLAFENDYFDATGFYAGRPEKAGDKLYCFAWCAMLSGGSTGEFDWGGNLIAHELKQMSDGSLAAVMPESIEKAISTPVVYDRTSGGAASGFDFDGEFAAYCMERLSSNITRMTFDITAYDYNGDFGISFGLDSATDNVFGTGLIVFDVKNSAVTVYNDTSNRLRYGSVLATMPFTFAAGKTYRVSILLSGEVFVVYVDDTVALTGRCTDLSGNNFAFYSNGTRSSIKEIKFYE